MTWRSKKCCRCDEVKDELDFSPNRNTPSGRQPYCKVCGRVGANERAMKRYHRRRKWINFVKLRIGCTECGFKEHSAALQFDHIDRGAKHKDISKMVCGNSIKRIFEEIRKCRVLCANCHAVHTRNQQKEKGFKITV